ncbi:hypothetical protein ACFVH6_03740 [Spirillospora sp. NPDC127200]
MSRAEQAAAELQRIKRLADRHGPALRKAYATLASGALEGPAGGRLFAGMAERHQAARSGFYEAFDQVKKLASQAEGGPPRVSEPYVPGPPRGGPRESDAVRSGSPELLGSLGSELAQAGRSWQEAGHALAQTLTGLGLSAAPGTRVRHAGDWLSAQRQDLERRRAELLKSDQPQPAPVPVCTVKAVTPGAPARQEKPSLKGAWKGYLNHYLPGVLNGAKDIGLAGLAANPWTAPVYLAVSPKGWVQRGPIGQLKGLYQGVQDPVAFAKAMVDWEEWTRDPLRALGEAGPGIILTVVTGGTAAGSGAATRLGAGARNLGGKVKNIRPTGRETPDNGLPGAARGVKPDSLETSKPTPPPAPKPPAKPPEQGDIMVAGPPRSSAPPSPGDRKVAGTPDKKVAGPGGIIQPSASGDRKVADGVGSFTQLPKAKYAHYSADELQALTDAAGGLRGVYERHGADIAGVVIGAEAKEIKSGQRAHIVRRVTELGLPQQEAASAAMYAAQRTWGQAGQIELPNGDIAVVPGHPAVPDTFVVSPDGKMTVRKSHRWYNEDTKKLDIKFLD